MTATSKSISANHALVELGAQQMRVVMATRSLDYACYGGGARHTLELAHALRELGCTVQLVSLERRDPPGNRSSFVDAFHPVLRPPLDLFCLNAKLVLEKGKYDVAHSQSRDGFAFFLRKRLPLVTTMHGLTAARVVLQDGYRPSTRVLAGLERLVCTRADHVIATSHSVESKLARWLGIGGEHVSVICNGVDIHRFNPRVLAEVVRQRYGLGDHFIVCVSRLERGRFVESLVSIATSVLSQLPRTKMVIVGEGPERLRLAQLFKLHGCDENVILVGPKDDRELPSFYAAADICIMPMAYQVPELVMLEAMACGKPVIFTSRGFCELEGDFVHERNIIMAKDEQDIADRSVQMLMDSRKRQAIGAAGRATVVSKYSWPMIASKTLKVYESVL